MNTPTQMQRSSTLSRGITPLETESTTARATAAWAGPDICTACLAPLIVTLLYRIVSGFAGRFGATTARRVVKPSLLLVSALANAAPACPDLAPMIKSMWATSLPSPTSDSPRKKSAAMGSYLRTSLDGENLLPIDRRRAREADPPCQSGPPGCGRAPRWAVPQAGNTKRVARRAGEDGRDLSGCQGASLQSSGPVCRKA